MNWVEEAESELATLWMNPALRAAVTSAARLIDERPGGRVHTPR